MQNLSTGRCPAAHPDDRSECVGAHDAVIIIDAHGTRVPACTHHGTVMLASLHGGRVHPGSVAGAAIDVYRRAETLEAFSFWSRRGER